MKKILIFIVPLILLISIFSISFAAAAGGECNFWCRLIYLFTGKITAIGGATAPAAEIQDTCSEITNNDTCITAGCNWVGPGDAYGNAYGGLACVTPCGNGVIEGTEQCDDGVNNNVPCTPLYGSSCIYCSGTCTNVTLIGEYCGDSIINGAEQCDDNNTISGDGCSSTCTTEAAAVVGHHAAAPNVYALNQIELYNLAGETSLNLNIHDEIKVTINGEEHAITVIDIDYFRKLITITIASEPFEVVLAEGDSANVDVNKDGFNDIKITFLGFVGGKVNVLFEKIPAVCGNSKCEIGESQTSCCIDCGCFANEECKNNACVSKIAVSPPAPAVPSAPTPPKVIPPSLPAYIQSSVLKDIASTSFLAVSFVIALIAASLLVKKLIKRRKKKKLFRGY